MRIRRLLVNLILPLLAGGVTTATAQNFPAAPIRIVAPGTGSGGDFVARLIAPALASSFGQPVVVDNRPGQVAIPVEIVMKSVPDGHTLLLHGSAVWLLPFLRDKVSYDPLQDLAPVAILISPPVLLVVHRSLPVKSVKELVALARARPGDLNYATSGTGNAIHLASELFRVSSAINTVRVNYKAASNAVTDLMSGQVQYAFGAVAGMMPHIRSDRLRALAITSAAPSALAPGVPTLASSFPNYGDVVALQGVHAPARTPAATIARISQEIASVLQRPDIREGLLNSGVEPVGSTPQEFGAKIKQEMVKWGKLIREAGIRED